MKLYLTLATCMTLVVAAQSQVLNELYTIPNNGKHEFFELYNNSIYQTPTSMDTYTMITYFEGAGSEKGFYVLDMPNLLVQPKGYFVGSAALPFNYQGVSNSTKSNFSWNNIAFLAANNGYMKKWVVGNAVPAAIDGNANYDEQPVPVNFNDFFYRRTGGQGSYSVFIYNNGILVNAFFAGTSATVTPSFIIAMPALHVQMAGGVAFDINFSTYANINAEFANAEAGSDNGYIRNRDGICGSWSKSSAGVQHTPGETNGPQSAISGSIVVFATVERGLTPTDSSTVIYNILSAPAAALPITVSIYIDNGTAIGELDPSDGFLASNVVSAANGTEYRINFVPRNASVIVTITTPAGCYDKVVYVSNVAILSQHTLPGRNVTRDPASQGIVLKKNPVHSSLDLSFYAIRTESADITIYDIAGVKLSTTKMKTQKGVNAVTLPLEPKMANGVYVVEVRSGTGRWTAKFLKN